MIGGIHGPVAAQTVFAGRGRGGPLLDGNGTAPVSNGLPHHDLLTLPPAVASARLTVRECSVRGAWRFDSRGRQRTTRTIFPVVRPVSAWAWALAASASGKLASM
ncbi:hypothetical protein GCM10010185_57990 [Saccharothrix coeruleofusca]|uniref:Uncharacterized protein n=1 Tax=Saccharothrix coeruleofusca TaxID=33919 RepID=A0A918EGX3_9PSEU|nr:hypothetical protein GCM10010185_57990 [Saccharothrix coeruleofusca]